MKVKLILKGTVSYWRINK